VSRGIERHGSQAARQAAFGTRFYHEDDFRPGGDPGTPVVVGLDGSHQTLQEFVHGTREARGGPQAKQKCEYCAEQATQSILHSEGMAYTPVCDKHLGKGTDAAEHCTPDGTRDPSNIVRVEKIAAGRWGPDHYQRTDAHDLVDYDPGYARSELRPEDLDQTPIRPGPWYHVTRSPGVKPGTILDPEQPNSFNYHTEELSPRDRWVFMHHDPEAAAIYGDNVWEVEPQGDGPYAYNGEDKAWTDGWVAPKAKVLRKYTPPKPTDDPGVMSFAEAMERMGRLERLAALPPNLQIKYHPDYSTVPKGKDGSSPWMPPVAVAEMDGSPVGYLEWFPTNDDSPTANGGEVSMVRVEPNFRRQGIGTALWDWVKENVEPELRHSDMQSTEGYDWATAVDARQASQRTAMPAPGPIYRGLTLDLSAPEGTFGAASPKIRELLKTHGPEAPEFIEELLRNGTGSYWTRDKGIAESINQTMGDGLQVVMNADWDGNDAQPLHNENLRKLPDSWGDMSLLAPQENAVSEFNLKPGKELPVKSIRVRRKGEPSWREILRQPVRARTGARNTVHVALPNPTVERSIALAMLSLDQLMRLATTVKGPDHG